MRYICGGGTRRTGKTECSSNLKIRPYHIAASCVNASPAAIFLSFFLHPPSSSIYNPSTLHLPSDGPSHSDCTCRNETKECNSSAGGRTIPRFSSFRETYGAKSRVLFLKYFSVTESGDCGAGCWL